MDRRFGRWPEWAQWAWAVCVLALLGAIIVGWLRELLGW